MLEFLDKVGKPIIGWLGDTAKVLAPLIDLLGDILEPFLLLWEGWTSFLADGYLEAFGVVDETNDKIADSNGKTMSGLTEGGKWT